MLKTIGLLLIAVVAAVISFVAMVRLTNLAQFAFSDFVHPLCGWASGRCDPEIAEDVKWTAIVLFSSLGCFVLTTLRVLFPRW